MKVSVIIPTYNYAGFIIKAIETVFLQDYPSELIEVIVVDDGSTDDTANVLQELIVGRKIVYYNQQNAGKAAATQKGIEIASGDVIFNLDADDWFLPGKIRKTIDIFKAHTAVFHVAGAAMLHWQDGSRKDESEQLPQVILDRPVSGPQTLRYFFDTNQLWGGGSTFAARASILKKMRWNAGVDMYTDEWLLIESMLKGDSYFFSEPLSVWNVHGNNYSGDKVVARQITKHQRLEKSSAAVLNLIKANSNYPGWLKNRYQLKHEIRKIVWLEERGTKGLNDIGMFALNALLSGNKFSVLRSYHAFNRLLPSFIIRIARRKDS